MIYNVISIYHWFKHGRICCKWTLNKNLTNVRIYDCVDLSLCQVHCCKYGEQIKKRPCCHSIVQFYIVFSTKRKLYTNCSYDFFLKLHPSKFLSTKLRSYMIQLIPFYQWMAIRALRNRYHMYLIIQKINYYLTYLFLTSIGFKL